MSVFERGTGKLEKDPVDKSNDSIDNNPAVAGAQVMMDKQTEKMVRALLYQFISSRHAWWTCDYDGQIMNQKYVRGLEFAMRQIPELLQVAEGAVTMTLDPTVDLDDDDTYDLDSKEYRALLEEVVNSSVTILKMRWAISGAR